MTNKIHEMLIDTASKKNIGEDLVVYKVYEQINSLKGG